MRPPDTAVANEVFRVRACALVELRRSVPEWSVPRHRHRFGSAIGTSSVLVLAAIVPAQPRGSLRSVAMAVLLLCTGVLRLTYVDLASFVVGRGYQFRSSALLLIFRRRSTKLTSAFTVSPELRMCAVEAIKLVGEHSGPTQLTSRCGHKISVLFINFASNRNVVFLPLLLPLLYMH